MVLLDPTLVTISEWGGVIGAVSIALIALGEFFRRADPMLWPFPAAAEVLGWLSWVGLSVVRAQVAGEGGCTASAAGCPTSFSSALWSFAAPYATDLAVAVAVTVLAWVAATVWLWARRRGHVGRRHGARAA